MDKEQTIYTIEERLAAIGVMVNTRELLLLLLLRDRDRIDIEATLADALVALANDGSSFRLLGPVFSWIEVHAASVIVEKLVKFLTGLKSSGNDTSYAALAGRFATSRGHRKWTVLKAFAEGTSTSLEITAFNSLFFSSTGGSI